MKKIYLAASLLLGSFVVMAQQAALPLTKNVQASVNDQSLNKLHLNGYGKYTGSQSNAIQSTSLLFEDFPVDIPSSWSNFDSLGTLLSWTQDTLVLTGTNFLFFDSNYTSYLNGSAWFDSYANTQATINVLTTSAINCSGYNTVKFSFNEFYVKGINDSAKIYVSNDSVNWTLVHDATTGLSYGFAYTNPKNYYDISTVAANQSTVYLKFYFECGTTTATTGNRNFYWIVDDINVFAPDSVDLSLNYLGEAFNNSLYSFYTICEFDSLTPVGVQIINRGITPLSNFNVYYTINGGTLVTETYSGTLNADDTTIFNFTATANIWAPGSYTLQAYVSIPGDGTLDNDSISASFKSLSHNDPNLYQIGFEGEDDFVERWGYGGSAARLDGNADGVTWNISTTRQRNGDNCLRKGASDTDDDDWAYTGCFDFAAGEVYNLDFWFKHYDYNNVLDSLCDLEVMLGTYPVPDSMAVVNGGIKIVTVPIGTIVDTIYYNSSTNFSVPVTGLYYVGIHAYSVIPTNPLRIDDIKIHKTTGVYDNTLEKGITVYPNPSNGLVSIENKTKADVLITIYNSMGQSIYSKQFDRLTKAEVDLSNHANGIYSVQIRTNDAVATKSVVISH
jgi:hypothetical protein